MRLADAIRAQQEAEERLRAAKRAEWAAREVEVASMRADTRNYRIGFLSDTHAPHHHRPTIAIFLRALVDLDLVPYIKGDFLDLEAANRHPPTGAPVPDVSDEYEAGNIILDAIDAACAERDAKHRGKRPHPVRSAFEEGNHCQRHAKFIERVPAQYRSQIQSPREALELDERGYTWVEIPTTWKDDDPTKPVIAQQPIMLHGYASHHGQSYSKVHASTQLGNNAISEVYGHTHRPQQLFRALPNRETGSIDYVACVTGFPCSCRPIAPWTAQPRLNGWCVGFGIGEVFFHEDGQSEMHVYNVVLRRRAGVWRAAYGGFRWEARGDA